MGLSRATQLLHFVFLALTLFNTAVAGPVPFPDVDPTSLSLSEPLQKRATPKLTQEDAQDYSKLHAWASSQNVDRSEFYVLTGGMGYPQAEEWARAYKANHPEANWWGSLFGKNLENAVEGGMRVTPKMSMNLMKVMLELIENNKKTGHVTVLSTEAGVRRGSAMDQQHDRILHSRQASGQLGNAAYLFRDALQPDQIDIAEDYKGRTYQVRVTPPTPRSGVLPPFNPLEQSEHGDWVYFTNGDSRRWSYRTGLYYDSTRSTTPSRNQITMIRTPPPGAILVHQPTPLESANNVYRIPDGSGRLWRNGIYYSADMTRFSGNQGLPRYRAPEFAVQVADGTSPTIHRNLYRIQDGTGRYWSMGTYYELEEWSHEMRPELREAGSQITLTQKVRNDNLPKPPKTPKVRNGPAAPADPRRPGINGPSRVPTSRPQQFRPAPPNGGE